MIKMKTYKVSNLRWSYRALRPIYVRVADREDALGAAIDNADEFDLVDWEGDVEECEEALPED